MRAWACCVSRGTVAWRRELLTVLRLLLSSPLADPTAAPAPQYGIACSAPMSFGQLCLFCCLFFVEITCSLRKRPTVNTPPTHNQGPYDTRH